MCVKKFSTRGKVDKHQMRVHMVMMVEDRTQRISSTEVNENAIDDASNEEEEYDVVISISLEQCSQIPFIEVVILSLNLPKKW